MPGDTFQLVCPLRSGEVGVGRKGSTIAYQSRTYGSTLACQAATHMVVPLHVRQLHIW